MTLVLTDFDGFILSVEDRDGRAEDYLRRKGVLPRDEAAEKLVFLVADVLAVRFELQRIGAI